MEHASQAFMASDRKRKRPEGSALSSSGKISRTGEQYGFQWEFLPEEIVVSVFDHLQNQDLLACRAVCKRFARVIGESVLLDKAKAFWKQFYQPPDPALFSRDRYKLVLRPWYEACATAQQRLPGASGDLPFADSKGEENERQASSEQTEQIQAIESSQVKQLDRLTEHREFPKALFFIQTKTLQNADSLYWQEKISHSCAAIVTTVCFSPDGRNLLISFGKTIRLMVLDESGNVIRGYNKDYNFPVKGLRFSPNGRSLLIGFNHSIMIMGLDGEDWVQKGETGCQLFFQESVCFSPDSDSLATLFDNSVRITGRDEKGNWVLNSEFHFSDAQAVYFSPDGSSLAISDSVDIWIMGRDAKGNWVQNSKLSVVTSVESVCFSPDGGSLAITGRSNLRRSVLIMRSDGKGNWVQNFMIPCDYLCSAHFSPDGHNLILKSVIYPKRSWIIGLDRANSRVCKYGPFLHNDAVCLSPDGGSLAMGRGSSTLVMGLDKGKGNWVKKACIPDKWRLKYWEVEAVCFSPDSRRLAIISVYRCGGYRKWKSQTKIYEIKTGAKVLTDRDN